METPIGKQIAAAFVKAQKAFGPALKTSTNPHFRSKYADLSNCIEAVIGALNDNGIGLLQRTYESKDGVMVETIFVHESGEVMECGLLHVPASKQDPQGYMSALTYARRGSLMAACGIAPEDDDGNAASRKAPTMDVSTYVSNINDCENLEDLKAKFAIAIAACGTDSQAKAKVIAAKDARKAEL